MVSCSAAELPAEILQGILSLLTWRQQMGVRRVSRRWQAAADTCLARRRELHIGEHDFPTVLDDQMLERLLQNMPVLRSLSVDSRSGEEELDVDVVSEHCCHLVEVDLISFRVDARAVERLSTSCPQLQHVTLPGKTDDTCVAVLSRCLPGLRSLYMAHTSAEGECLSQLPAALERLTLADGQSLQPASFRQLAGCPQLRQLDVSRTRVHGDDLAAVVLACPRLQRLSVASCSQLGTLWLPQLANHPQLRDLDVSYLMVHNGNMSQLPDLLPRLRALSIRNCRPVTARGLISCLPRLRHLESLDMTTTRGSASAPVLDKLHGLPLRSVVCGRYNDRVTGAGIASLVLACPSLKFFQLAIGCTDVVREAVDLLVAQLPPDRDVTLSVHLSVVQKLQPPPPGPLRVVAIKPMLHINGRIS